MTRWQGCPHFSLLESHVSQVGESWNNGYIAHLVWTADHQAICIFLNIKEFYWFHTGLTDGQVSGWTLNLEFDSPLDDLQCFAGDVSPSSDGVSWEALWLRLWGFCLPQLWRGAKRHTKGGGLNKLRDQPKVHWSVVPCEWDSDFQVGDTMDIPFQVRSISLLSNIVNVTQNWS